MGAADGRHPFENSEIEMLGLVIQEDVVTEALCHHCVPVVQ